MKIDVVDVQNRGPFLIEKLIELWEGSITTAHFLTIEAINGLKNDLPDFLKKVPVLIIAIENNSIIGFATITNKEINMLFITKEEMRKGYGSQLLEYAINEYNVFELEVHEQNEIAKSFYKKHGFKIIKKRKVKNYNNSFPIIKMKKIRREIGSPLDLLELILDFIFLCLS